jgi:allophanate hydrolase subunit 2
MVDAGTTGGYPRIAKVIDADLWQLAHTPIGSSITLECVDIETSIASLREHQQHIDKIRFSCRHTHLY